MATVYGVNQTLYNTGGLANQVERGIRDARVKVSHDYYEASALASGSSINVCGTLPDKAVILDVVLLNDALADVSVSVGDAIDTTRYIGATSMAAATVTRLGQIGGFRYTIGTTSPDNQLILTTSGLSAATGTLAVAVIYSQD